MENKMKKTGIVFGIAAFLCICALLAAPAAAAAIGVHNGPACGDRMTGTLDKLEEQGYDVSAIRAAVESGDMETARELMQEFMTANPDARPPQGAGPGNGERMTGTLDKLEEQGYDVSAIRAAVESGDMETARDLLKEFMSANPDARPPRGNVQGGGN
jgi:ABC-type uncharacterized transport system substrate-binding protein